MDVVSRRYIKLRGRERLEDRANDTHQSIKALLTRVSDFKGVRCGRLVYQLILADIRNSQTAGHTDRDVSKNMREIRF